MIPQNINKEHIIQAIEKVRNEGIPSGRDSRKFDLFYEDKKYPPKYIISLANKFANGAFLDSNNFSGGMETNSFLKNMGFEIVPKSMTSKAVEIVEKHNRPAKHYPGRHNERCPECKKIVEKLLGKIYGTVKSNYSFEIGAVPEAFESSEHYNVLQDIFKKLQLSRGHKNFVHITKLPRVDFFVPNPGIIIEFDESQHFTSLRKETLIYYPDTLRLGFSKSNWIRLCEQINAKDNDPAYRDEQRAWYDTLRDFLPSIKNLRPTVRLHSKEYHWCNLDPENNLDVEIFRNRIDMEHNKSSVSIISDPEPSLARLIIAGDWQGDLNSSKKVLQNICNVWPGGLNVKFTITCGAFLTFELPDELHNLTDNKEPEAGVLELLSDLAIKQCKMLVDEDLRLKLSQKTDYITIGVDSYKNQVSLSSVSINKLHVEMVVLLDLKQNKYFVTGKSYPTPGQQNGLIRFTDLNSHFIDLPYGKVMLLGCHDLNAFNPRGAATAKKEWRRKILTDFCAITQKENPKIVLHHPHTTDCSSTWTSAWNALMKLAPSIHQYIGAGRYDNQQGPRSELKVVLQKTKLGNSIDFILHT